MIQWGKEYHRRTSYDRGRMYGHFLDWANLPNVFKTYPGLATIALPETLEPTSERMSDLLLTDHTPQELEISVNVDLAAGILQRTQAVTAKTRHSGMDFFFRSVASAGALYPTELYMASVNVSGLDNGLYHHTLGVNCMTLLRPGNLLSEISEGVSLSQTSPAALIFFLTAIFFRSSWKYRDRAYRYHLLDTGHMVENLALALRQAQLGFEVHYDFDDSRLNALLGLDESREVCLAVAAAWGKAHPSSEGSSEMAPAAEALGEASRVSSGETEYPVIQEIHAASCRGPGSEAVLPAILDQLGPTAGEALSVSPQAETGEVMSYHSAVLQRRSARNFVPGELSRQAFSTLLQMLSATGTGSQRKDSLVDRSLAVGFLAHHVDGLEPGFYLLDREQAAPRPVFKGSVADRASHLCLDQAWLENCSIHFLFLSNLELLDRICGPRGYRYAMLAAGRLGQRLYLGATAMRLGCCGIGAFYDREAADLLGLNEDSELLYLVGLGPIKKWYSR